MALILARWNRPSDFLTIRCRRKFALAFAAAAAAAAASRHGVAAFFHAGGAAASSRDVAAFFRGAAAVIRLVAAAGSPLSYSATEKVTGIVITKVVTGAVTAKGDAARTGWVRTLVRKQRREFDRCLCRAWLQIQSWSRLNFGS